MRVLAVDPGGTTGWAFRDDRGEVRWGQVPGGLEGFVDTMTFGSDFEASSVFEPVHYNTPTVLVIERYTIQERTTKFSRQMDAPEIIGHLKGLARKLDIEVVMQQPAQAKRLFTDDRLRQFGWWAKGEEHARDALRHLGYYLATKRLIRLTKPGA